MRKIIAIMISILIFCLGGVAVSAETAVYETAGDLYRAWYDGSAQRPDYICGVWSTDGGDTNLTFGIQDTDEGKRGKQEILDMIVDDSTVSFEYQKYSENYLYQINEEIIPYFQKDLGIVSCGVYVMENRVEIEIHKDRKNDPATKEMVKEFKEKYGDAVHIEYGDFYVTTTLEETNPSANNTTLILAVAAFVLLAMTATFAVWKARTAAVQTNTGTVVTSSAGYSTKAVESMVKESSVSVPSELDARIMDSIDEIQ